MVSKTKKTATMKEFLKISEVEKYEENPFLEEDVLHINKGTKSMQISAGNQILVNEETGEQEGFSAIHKYKEVDKESFVKLFVNEISVLFDLSKTGMKVFGYVLECLRINKATIYIDINDVTKYCNYKHKNMAYKGLAELVQNKIIAMSKKTNLWYINPNIVFNGNRIAFIKEYRLKDTVKVNDTIKLDL